VQNKLAKAFDETFAFQNVRTARPGPDGGMYSIIDMAIETNVKVLNMASTCLTAKDFDPYAQGHCVHTRLCKGYRVAATIANSKHQGGTFSNSGESEFYSFFYATFQYRLNVIPTHVDF